MLRRLPTLLLCLLTFSFTACDSDSDGDNGGGGGGGTPPSAGIEATVDGNDFRATVVATASRDDTSGTISISGTDGMQAIGLTIRGVAEDTYEINTAEGTTGSVTRITSAGVSEAFSTIVGGSGSIRITSISQTQVAGTFSFSATSSTSTGSIDVTGGFNVNIIQQ